MQTALLANLESAMEDFVAKTVEETTVYVPDDLHIKMTQAAAIVWDANECGQLFAEEQEK